MPRFSIFLALKCFAGSECSPCRYIPICWSDHQQLNPVFSNMKVLYLAWNHVFWRREQRVRDARRFCPGEPGSLRGPWKTAGVAPTRGGTRPSKEPPLAGDTQEGTHPLRSSPKSHRGSFSDFCSEVISTPLDIMENNSSHLYLPTHSGCNRCLEIGESCSNPDWKGEDKKSWVPPHMCPIPLTLIFIFFPGFSIC